MEQPLFRDEKRLQDKARSYSLSKNQIKAAPYNLIGKITFSGMGGRKSWATGMLIS